MRLGWCGAYIFVAATAFVLCLGLLPIMRWLSLRLGLLDHPGERKLQDRPMPLLGGGAILLAYGLTVGIGLIFVGQPELGHLPVSLEVIGAESKLAHAQLDRVLGVFIGGLMMFTVGLLDDVLKSRFPPALKLLGQFLAATVFVTQGNRLDIFPGNVLDVLFALLWVVAITNAVNFMDNMDGLAAGVGFIACVMFFSVAVTQLEVFIASALAALAGALLAFLLHNFPPASIYLGNSGSYLLGYMLATLTVLESYVTRDSSTLYPVVMPLLVLALPLVDMASVVCIRLSEGRPIYVGDRRHLSHRLVALGMSGREAVLILYLECLAVGISATLLSFTSIRVNVALTLQAVAILGILVLTLAAHRARQPLALVEKRSPGGTIMESEPVLADCAADRLPAQMGEASLGSDEQAAELQVRGLDRTVRSTAVIE